MLLQGVSLGGDVLGLSPAMAESCILQLHIIADSRLLCVKKL